MYAYVSKGTKFLSTQNFITNVNNIDLYYFDKLDYFVNIVNYVNLENGNYGITYFTQEGSEEILSFAEIDKNGYLVKVTSELLVDDGDENYVTTYDYSFEYGVLEENNVLALKSNIDNSHESSNLA